MAEVREASRWLMEYHTNSFKRKRKLLLFFESENETQVFFFFLAYGAFNSLPDEVEKEWEKKECELNKIVDGIDIGTFPLPLKLFNLTTLAYMQLLCTLFPVNNILPKTGQLGIG